MFHGINAPPATQHAYRAPRIFVRISGAPTGRAFPWTQQVQTTAGNGTWQDDANAVYGPGTATSFPAYLADQSTACPVGTICEAEVNYAGFLIAWPLGEAIAVGSGSGAYSVDVIVLPSYRTACIGGIAEVYRTDLTYTDGALTGVSNEYWAYDAGCCDCEGFPPGGSFTPPGGPAGSGTSGTSGTSGGGGGGGTVTVPCCPGPVDQSQCATFGGGTGAAACLNGIVVGLNWDSVNLQWQSGQITLCGSGCAIDLNCGSGTTWGLQGNGQIAFGGMANGVCSPFGITFSNLAVSGAVSGTVTVTIGPCGGGGGGGGGGPVITACCPDGLATTLHVTFGGALASLGTVAFAYNAGTSTWGASIGAASTPCGFGNSSLTCNAATGQFELSGVLNEVQNGEYVQATFLMKASPTYCTPWQVSWSGTLIGSGPCLGAMTATGTL